MENFLKGKKHVHFIGIGGSGMYPEKFGIYQAGAGQPDYEA